MPEEFDVHQLEFYTQQEARKTFLARVVLLALIFSMLAANMWMTRRNHEAILVNINQARLEQVALDEGQQRDLLTIKQQIAAMDTQLTAVRAAQQAIEDAKVVATR